MRNAETVDLDREIGARIHQIMWNRRITQTAVAPVLRVDPTLVGRKLRGERAWTSADLTRIAKFLGVKFEITADGCAIRDSNPEPADLEHRPYAPVLVLRRRDNRSNPVQATVGGAA